MLKVYQKANAYGLGKGGGRIEGLDGLRTLAIVGVTLLCSRRRFRVATWVFLCFSC